MIAPAILALLEDCAGLVFPAGRLRDVERNIAGFVARPGMRTEAHLLERLRADKALREEFIEGLLVGETYFFREPEQFEIIRTTVLPEFLRGKPRDNPVQIWSAGCATGEEAYSLAILLREEGLDAHGDILATDIAEPALCAARNGVYEAWSFRGAGSGFADRYFHMRGNRFHILPALRKKVSFATANLAAPGYPQPACGGGFDLVLCRNVLIYFSEAAVRAVAARLFASLNEGGWLVTAPSDPPLGGIAPFETVMTGAGAFYRKPAARNAARPAMPARKPVPATGRAMPARLVPAMDAPTPEPGASADSPESCERRAAELYAEGRTAEALAVLRGAIQTYPLSRPLHFLYAVGLLDGSDLDGAAAAARRLVCLDRHSAAAHMLLGTIARQRGDRAGAMRAYRNGLSSCGDSAADAIVPLAGYEPYGNLAEAMAAELAALQAGDMP